jgi:hypothetical protein
MMREFTTEMLAKVEASNESVKGTCNYGAYYVPFEAKTKGKWHFLGWGVANRTGVIKKINNTYYVYYKDGFDNDYRFRLTDIYLDMLDLLEVA